MQHKRDFDLPACILWRLGQVVGIFTMVPQFIFQNGVPAFLFEGAVFDLRQIPFDRPMTVRTSHSLLPSRSADRPGADELIEASLLLLLRIAGQSNQVRDIASPVASGVIKGELV